MKYWLLCNRNQFLGRERNFQRMLEKEREIDGYIGILGQISRAVS